MAFHLGVKLQKKHFWAQIVVFKRTRNRKTCIRITSSISAKFCTVIKTIKCLSWVVQTHASQIKDGGQPPSWKNWKITICRSRFERFWRNLATILTVSTVKNFKNFKNPRWRNPKIAISRLRFERSARNLVRLRILTLQTVSALKISNFQKITDGGRPPSWKIAKFSINGHY